MLNDYLDDYLDAEKKNDKKRMNKILKDLEKIGMDAITFKTLLKSYKTKGDTV